MIVLLNVLPGLVIFIGLAIMFKMGIAKMADPTKTDDENLEAFKIRMSRIGWVAVGTIGLAFTIAVLTPSYLPKGKVKRMSTPENVPSEAVIQDRSRQPSLTEEERERRNKELFDAVEQVRREREKKENQG